LSIYSADVNRALNALVQQGLVIITDEPRKLYFCEYCRKRVASLPHDCEKGVR
jgi:hypothetical protein